MTDLIQFAASGAPPLAPEPFSPNDTQQRFMWLHERHFVTVWKWLWQGATFRAFTDRGVTASISKDDVNELVEHGLMRWGTGYTIELTTIGREMCASA